MVEIPLLDSSEAPRARRWDALVIGSGIPALVAAARMGSAGQRVLVVEEEARTQLPGAVIEPFFLAGLRDEGILDTCLRDLAIDLIHRRRIVTERLAYQIASDSFRLDIGKPVVTVEELVTWGLAKPDDARTLVRRLIEASEIERELLQSAAFVRIGRRIGGPRLGPAIGNHRRGLPGDAAAATGPLRRVIAAQIRSLSNVGGRAPSPESQARLLGLGLAGGVGFSGDPPWLVDLLRKRVTAAYGDFRTLSGDFELVSVSGQPGLRRSRNGEIWLGRALVLAVPLSALRDRLDNDPLHPAPSFLGSEVERAYRGVFLYRVPTAILPEGMCARIILPGAETDDIEATTVSVTVFPSQTHPAHIDLVARGVVPVADPATLPLLLENLQASIARRLEALMPFSEDRLTLVEVTSPQWDSDDGWLEDPRPGMGWPAETDLRLSSRLPIYHLDRAAVGGLGLEGDLLLGWRGGDAIARELA